MASSTKDEITFVEVKWEDAWGDATVAVFPQDAHEGHKAEVIRTYGWLVLKTDKGVSIFSEKCDDGSYRGRSFIPRAMILSLTPLKLSKPRKKAEVPNETISSNNPLPAAFLGGHSRL